MKTLFTLIFVISSFSVLHGEEKVANVEILAIISEQAEIAKKVKDLEFWNGKVEDKQKHVELLHTRRKAMHTRIRGLQPLIEKGRTIFDYKGLLALGRVHYREKSRVYELMIPTGRNHLGPMNLRIVFELDGKIRRVNHLALIS